MAKKDNKTKITNIKLGNGKPVLTYQSIKVKNSGKKD